MFENLRVYGGLGLRHALTYGAGLLAARGYFTSAEGEQAVSAVLVLIGIGLSIAQKFKSQKQISSARSVSNMQ